MRNTYSSGNPRLHGDLPEGKIRATISEYEEYAEKHPREELSTELLETAQDLREELKLREVEERRRFGNRRFDDILLEIVQEESHNLLSIPGVYEVLSEHFNNEILERMKEEE